MQDPEYELITRKRGACDGAGDAKRFRDKLPMPYLPDECWQVGLV